ncbi:hypothetical protein BCR36DRAFT_411614 [Piromyces finnis]|uniref:Uncharacterized protein n=1 Tax=Piromyces finnis TaxID=1754191 RepID=A0A1Y1VBN5_9FUNG|nr:hypothetical protein BCR36DRAFT_411614 [Piromyces finnis]|eukprot:ORX52166.1 hypothetical protein BCR36DRAFT_411614 [Piromyces finnis]
MDNIDNVDLFSDNISDITPVSSISEEINTNNNNNVENNISKVVSITKNKSESEKAGNEDEKIKDNNLNDFYSDIEVELSLNSPEIIDKKIEKLENYVINSQSISSDNNNNSIISISSTTYSMISLSQNEQNENNKRETIDNNSGLIKKLKNGDDMYVEIVVNNNKTIINGDRGDTKTSTDNVNKQESSELKKVVRKRGRPRKKKIENSKSCEKEKIKIFHSTPQKKVSYFMEHDDDDDDDIIPTAEELFDKSFQELSQKDNRDNIENIRNKNPFEIIDSIFSSSDDDDIFMDRTLKIPGEGVLAYYKYDRRYHPAKILSYIKSNKTYKLLFWTGYKLTLKRKQFFTKYQPEFLTVELGEQRSEKDDVDLRCFKEDELNNYIKEFIPKAQEFLKKYSWRYKDFINLELNSIKTYKELIKSSFLGFLSNTEIEYTIDQFKLALVHKTLILDDLPIIIDISEDKLMKLKENNNNQVNNENNNIPSSSGHVTRRMKKKLNSENLPDSQRTNESDTIMSSLCVNELSFIDKLCRYILLPEFSIWMYMQLENKDYKESEKLCRDYEQSYDWVTEILHYRETFASGRDFIKKHQKA